MLVWVTDRFAGFHKWDTAPREKNFLQNRHRHLFHVKLTVQVEHDDRDVEFFELKDELTEVLHQISEYGQDCGSCEMIAKRICNDITESGYKVHSVEVSEDGENGSLYYPVQNTG